VSGLLANPNCEFPLNFVPLRTLAAFAGCSQDWDPRAAYLDAMREWLPRFEAPGPALALEDLVLLGDAYYLPHDEGPEAERLHETVRLLLTGSPAEQSERLTAFRDTAARLRRVCSRVTELRDRPLFHALSRRIWELREELDLLERCIEHRAAAAGADDACRSDFHLPGTYRGGLVARLQRLLTQHPDGTFTPASSTPEP
jgi:protein O-GlcNAcase/histone acetyltransferase